MYNKLIWDLVFVWFVFSRFLSVKSGGILVCKNGYEDMEGYCLKAHTETETFANAIEKCRHDGGQLVTIKNSDKQLVINNFRHQKQLPSNTRVWFGLKQNDTKWKWIDGTSLVYSNWRSSAITTGTDLCASLNLEYERVNTWETISCIFSFTFICEEATAPISPISQRDLQIRSGNWLRIHQNARHDDKLVFSVRESRSRSGCVNLCQLIERCKSFSYNIKDKKCSCSNRTQISNPKPKDNWEVWVLQNDVTGHL